MGCTLQESGRRGKNGHSTSGLLYKRVGKGEKMATVHRAYSAREWGGGERGKKWPLYIGPALQESATPKAGVESDFQGGALCFYSSNCQAIAVAVVPITLCACACTRGKHEKIFLKIIIFIECLYACAGYKKDGDLSYIEHVSF